MLIAALAAPGLAGCGSLGFGGIGLGGLGSGESAPPAPVAGAPAQTAAIAPQPTAAVVSSPPSIAPAAPAALPAPIAPALPTGAALGGVLGGPVGAALTDADRQAAWAAQVAALDSGKLRSWRGAKGVYGFVEPGAEAGAGCRAYAQTIYVAGRPNHGQGVACKQPDGGWRMTS